MSFGQSILISLIIGIVAGIISAIVFYWLMRRIKPKISIGPQIAKERALCEKGKPIKDDEGNYIYEYVIKIINYTKANIEDVSYQLFIMEDYFRGNGKMYETRKLEFKKSNSMKFLVGTKEKDHTIDNNCRQIVIAGNLEEEWDKNKEWLEFQIVSYHSKSGSRKVHKMKYTDRATQIIEGYFDTGHNFTIIGY